MVKTIIITLLALSFVSFAQADTSITGVLNSGKNALGETMPQLGENADDAVNIVAFRLMDAILLLAGVIAVFFITLSGVRLTISAGSQDQIDAAKRTLLWAILGLLAVILSWALMVNVVKLMQASDHTRTTQTGDSTGEYVDNVQEGGLGDIPNSA